MSDNLCGPSNALKSLGDHVNRDRSIHQDRAGAGQAGSSNFRSASNGNPNAEADYQAFINRGLTPLSMMPAGPDPQAFMEPGAPAHQQYLGGMRHPGPQGLQAFHGASAGAGHAQSSQWAAEFAANSAAAGPAAAAATRAPLPGHLYNQQPLQAVNRLQHFSMGVAPGPIHTPPGFAPYSSSNVAQAPSLINRGPGFASAPSFATATTTTTTIGMVANNPSAPSGVGNLTEAQLEAQFAAAQAEMDFEDEMNSWMATHGPTAADAAAAEEQKINEELEHMADELDAQRSTNPVAADVAIAEAEAAAAGLAAAEALAEETERAAAAEKDREDEELARIAGTIVHTLSGNSDVRFQESSFMHLMRRMEAREVTVRGDTLVEEATGLPIEAVATAEQEQAAASQQPQQTQKEQQEQQEQQNQQNQGV